MTTERGRRLIGIRHLVPLVFFISTCSAAAARHATALPGKSNSDSRATFAVNVEDVVLHVTVRKNRYGFVSGLPEKDFQVYEDGVPQKITYFRHEDMPVSVGLILDTSGSMGPKFQQVEAAALIFARSSNPDDQMFIETFNGRVSMALPPNLPFTSSESVLQDSLLKIRTTGRTALYDAVAAGLNHLKLGTRDKKVLLVVSDGGDNASRHTRKQVMKMAEESDAIIYTVGLYDSSDEDRNPKVLKKLARLTGGEVFLPNTVNQVVEICRRIARDIRNQYTIAYVPTNQKHDGTYRKVRVTVTAPGYGNLEVRTRSGYRAPTGRSLLSQESPQPDQNP